MKKIIIIMLSLLLITGCFGNNKEVSKTAYTTYYPIEYATNFLYSKFAKVKSIYPNGVNPESYELTDKQKTIYSKADAFIYAGVSNEVKLAADFINTNENINIIDSTKGVTFTNDISELWLDPSNYLMIARNIKSTLIDYTESVYDETKIEKAYTDLKVKISEIDVELTMMGKNASRNNIFVTDNSLSFLSKYNLNVISVDKNNESNNKAYNDVRTLINKGDIKYAYTIKGKTLDSEISTFIENNKLEIVEIDPMYTLSEEQRKDGYDYISIMNDNITKLKTELFR